MDILSIITLFIIFFVSFTLFVIWIIQKNKKNSTKNEKTFLSTPTPTSSPTSSPSSSPTSVPNSINGVQQYKSVLKNETTEHIWNDLLYITPDAYKKYFVNCNSLNVMSSIICFIQNYQTDINYDKDTLGAMIMILYIFLFNQTPNPGDVDRKPPSIKDIFSYDKQTQNIIASGNIWMSEDAERFKQNEKYIITKNDFVDLYLSGRESKNIKQCNYCTESNNYNQQPFQNGTSKFTYILEKYL